MIIGTGFDLVSVPGFADQLSVPGTAFAASFTGYERRVCAQRAKVSGSEATHLAARWAVKEAVIKAWSAAITGYPPPLEAVEMWRIEVRHDQWNRPYVLMPSLEAALAASLAEVHGPGTPIWHISLSHDGEVAGAQAILEYRVS